MEKCFCGNCDWQGDDSQVNPIQDIMQRIDPGGTVPAGECPECGALCYLDDTNLRPSLIADSTVWPDGPLGGDEARYGEVFVSNGVHYLCGGIAGTAFREDLEAIRAASKGAELVIRLMFLTHYVLEQPDSFFVDCVTRLNRANRTDHAFDTAAIRELRAEIITAIWSL